jgi:formylglycine-generating enzyme
MRVNKDKLVFIEGGEMMLGQGTDASRDLPRHKVRIKSFYLSKYPVSKKTFCRLLNKFHFGGFSKTPFFCPLTSDLENHTTDRHRPFTCYYGEKPPFTGISWRGANAFAFMLGGRLPTEREWEYAARGGTAARPTLYAGSNDLDEVGWYKDNAHKYKHDIGLKKPNELGLYDMSGNAWEWCMDKFYDPRFSYHSPYSEQDAIQARVIRGGSFADGSDSAILYKRSSGYVDEINPYIGFRVAYDIDMVDG